VEGCAQRAATTTEFDNPPLVELKNLAWSVVAKMLLSNDTVSDSTKGN
jgi:hypothetical protein